MPFVVPSHTLALVYRLVPTSRQDLVISHTTYASAGSQPGLRTSRDLYYIVISSRRRNSDGICRSSHKLPTRL